VILATAHFFVPCSIAHPVWMVAFLVLTATPSACSASSSASGPTASSSCSSSRCWSITPLTFLGGAFYSIDMLPPAWRTFSLFNPVVYLISGFRWSFYGAEDVPVLVSLAMTLGFFVAASRWSRGFLRPDTG
jgi:ABC-2 type transport system permease protein